MVSEVVQNTLCEIVSERGVVSKVGLGMKNSSTDLYPLELSIKTDRFVLPRNFELPVMLKNEFELIPYHDALFERNVHYSIVRDEVMGESFLRTRLHVLGEKEKVFSYTESL